MEHILHAGQRAGVVGGGTVMSKRLSLSSGVSQTPGEGKCVSKEENMLACGSCCLNYMDWMWLRIREEVSVYKSRLWFKHARREPDKRWPWEYIPGCLTVKGTVSAVGRSNQGKLLEAEKPTGAPGRMDLNHQRRGTRDSRQEKCQDQRY